MKGLHVKAGLLPRANILRQHADHTAAPPSRDSDITRSQPEHHTVAKPEKATVINAQQSTLHNHLPTQLSHVESRAYDAPFTSVKQMARRSMKVLSTEKVPQHKKVLYNENASNSPLLRLPPELRNRIWLILLGGKTIHITYSKSEGHGLRHMICRSDDELHEEGLYAEMPRHYPIDHLADTLYRSCHRNCSLDAYIYKAGAQRLSLECLQVCRQIHREAALIPYQTNTFAFADPQYLTGFLQAIILAQARAIESLELTGLSFEQKMFSVTLERLIKSKLTGLKKLTVFKNRERAQLLMGGLLHFAHLPLTSVQIVVLCQDLRREDGSWIVTTGPLDKATTDWVTEMERRLLAAAE